jgi:hypothetical protein
MSIDERQWDEMIIFLGKEMRRLKDRIEGWEEEKDLREIIDRQRQRDKFVQNLREILKEASDK